jgi:hypothetical protein
MNQTTITTAQLLPAQTRTGDILSIEEQRMAEENMCPDCDCLMEKSYDEFGSARHFCDNCGALVKDTTSINIEASDMDITMENCYSGW